jgi:CheY-like chemotaxis protein
MQGDKIYNLEFLKQYTGLNTDEGVGEYGMTRAQYFGELAMFEERVRPVLDRLLDKRPKREVVTDLGFLSQCLFSVCDTMIVPQIEETLVIIKNAKEDYMALSNKLFEIYKFTRRLGEFIRLAEIGKDQPVLRVFEGGGPEPQRTAGQSAAAPEEAPPTYRAAGAAAPVSAAEVVQNVTQTARPRILAIDDMPDVLTTIKVMLMYKYQIYGVTNAKAAFRFIHQNKPDLILMDIEMPDVNGIELLKEIRRLPGCADMPIIFLTGEANMSNIKGALTSGGNDFIRKPVEKNMLISRIEKHLPKE